MGQIFVKQGVEFGPLLAPAGARILEVLKQLVAGYDFHVTLTSARDGIHSGPQDPHHSGEAFDLRVNDLQPAQIQRLLNDLQFHLYRDPRRFYAFMEAPGTPNAHIHVQRRAATSYSAVDFLQDR
jgi:hypothetical protein